MVNYNEIKSKLGRIISIYRKIKAQEFKNSNKNEVNPYSKFEFCENNQLCHFNTLTKIEKGIPNDHDDLYFAFLKKLDLCFQVNLEEHESNIHKFDIVYLKLLKVVEFIDDDLLKKLYQEVMQYDTSRDCILKTYVELVTFLYKLQMHQSISPDYIPYFKMLIDFYEDRYKGLAYHCLGIYYLNRSQMNEAGEYLELAKKIYQNQGVSKGVIYSHIINVNMIKLDFYTMKLLCDEMEEFYQTTNNYKRLVHVYNFLTDYYFIIGSNDMALEYYNKSISIINQYQSLERYRFVISYNCSSGCYANDLYELAYEYANIAYKNCQITNFKLQIINKLLMLIYTLDIDTNRINELLAEGDQCFENSSEMHQIVFKYFKYKIENTSYYRKYANEKVIPYFKSLPSRMEFLLFFYQDLFKE